MSIGLIHRESTYTAAAHRRLDAINGRGLQMGQWGGDFVSKKLNILATLVYMRESLILLIILLF